MSKDILLLAAIGAAVVLVVSKQAKAAAPAGLAGGLALTNSQKAQMGLIYTPEQKQSVNVMGDLWTKLMGTDGWRTLSGAQNSDGSAAFLKRDMFGQVTTGDGKPVNSPNQAFSDVVTDTMRQENYLGQLSPYDEYFGW